MKKISLFKLCIFCSFLSFANEKKRTDHLDMKLNFQGDSLYIKANYKHYRLPSEIDSFYFLLGPDYPISTISGSGYLAHKITQKKDAPFPFILIYLKPEVRGKKELNFQFDYAINLKKSNYLLSDWLELGIDKFWFPCYNEFGTNFTSSVQINNLYEGFSVFSYPHAKITDLNDGTIKIVNKTPAPEVLILAGKNMREWNNADKKLKSIFLLVKHYRIQY